jgi:hypothetical protein
MTLTSAQQIAKTEIAESIAKKRWHMLNGFAGTAKT